MNDRAFARSFVKMILGLSESDQRRACKALSRTLASRGELSHGPKLLAHIEEAYAQAVGGRTIVIETARPLSISDKKRFESSKTTKDVIRYIVRPTLIAGSRITIDDSRVLDYSFSGRLAHSTHHGS